VISIATSKPQLPPVDRSPLYKQVLDRIEPFLLEIANMGEKPSREEVRSIGERVRQNEIVAALEVY